MYYLLEHDFSENDIIEMSKNARVLRVFSGESVRNGILFKTDDEKLLFAISYNGKLAWTYEGKIGEIRDANGDLIK